MRLICPNCGAQYEVPDDVIPTSGRDVQCSSCGHTWFQVHPDQDSGLAEELEQLGAEPDAEALDDSGSEHETAAPDDGETEAPEAAAEPGQTEWVTPDVPLQDSEDDVGIWQPETRQADSGEGWDENSAGVTAPQMPTPPVEDYEDDYETWDDDPSAQQPAMPEQRRSLDPDLADLLREEAEREARQRAAERGTLESQPDLGLMPSEEDEAARRQREAQERMARLRGAPVPETDPVQADEAAAAAAAAAASRRDLLPDIDEINSTLRSTNERRPSTADDHDRPGAAPVGGTDAQERRGGFRRGFALVVLIMALALVLYVFAPRLADAVPALRAPLAAYVDMMNGLRLWIDGLLRDILGWLDSVAGE